MAQGSRVPESGTGRFRNRSKTGVVKNRGTCPVCRRGNLAVRQKDGKMGPHGKTAASPSGCAGAGQPPMRPGRDGVERPQLGATVVGFRSARPDPIPKVEPVDPDNVDVQVTRRDPPDLDIRLRPPPDMNDVS